MRDDDRRAAPARGVQGVLDDALGRGVERRRRLVEQQDFGVARDGARDRDALLLAAAQLHAALAHGRVVPLGQRRDERVRVGGARGRLEARARDGRAAVGGRAAVRDVVGDGPRKQQRLLRHEADL